MTHTIERVRTHREPSTGTDPHQPPRRSRRTAIGWAAIAAALVATVVLVLLTTMSGPSPQGITDQAPARPSIGGVPLSADGAERHLADREGTRPYGVPGSADGAERYLAE